MTKKSGFAITDEEEFATAVDKAKKEKAAQQLESVLLMSRDEKRKALHKKGIDPYWLNPGPLPSEVNLPLPPEFGAYEVVEFQGTLPELLNFIMNNFMKPPEKK